MAKIQFKSYPQGQTVLFPSDLGENIPENAPVRIVGRIVDGLNIDSLIETYEAFGCPPYHPRMLLKVVFYAYMNNTYSCRRIESAMLRDIYYMWLSGNEHPSYSTINRFRSGHVKDQINGLFVQVVEHLVEEGVLSLDVQYIDGTKVESVANKYTFVWRKTVERNKAKLEKKILGVLQQIEEGIAQDNSEEQSSEPVAIDSASLQDIVEKINAENAKMPESTKEEKQAKREREKVARELGKMQEKQAGLQPADRDQRPVHHQLRPVLEPHRYDYVAGFPVAPCGSLRRIPAQGGGGLRLRQRGELRIHGGQRCGGLRQVPSLPQGAASSISARHLATGEPPLQRGGRLLRVPHRAADAQHRYFQQKKRERLHKLHHEL